MFTTVLTLITATLVTIPPLSPVPADRAPEQDPIALITQGRELVNDGVDRNDLELIMQGRAVFERLLASPEHRALAWYYMGLAEYRLTNLSWAAGRRERRRHVEAAIDDLEQAVELDPDFAEAHALLGGACGLKIAINPLSAMSMGPKNQRARVRARELAPDNPRVVLLEAISLFNTPGAFGGDKEKALELTQRAADLFAAEQVTDPAQPSWGREEVHAWLGIILADAGRVEEARAAYEKALEINPDYGWVTYYLLPALPPPAAVPGSSSWLSRERTSPPDRRAGILDPVLRGN